MREKVINDSWLFAMGNHEGATEEYRIVNLPHDWCIEQNIIENTPDGSMQGYFRRGGIGWYKKTITIKQKGEKCFILDFDGVMENCTVFVNGSIAGGNGWGYTPFRVDITPFVHNGDNEIAVKCDCTVLPADRWYSGCGIYRSVRLLTLPQIHLDDRKVAVTCDVGENIALVNIETGCGNEVLASLTFNGEKVSEATGRGNIALQVSSPTLWSAENPALYCLCLTLTENGDTISFPIGIRKVEFTTDGFYVNGKKTFMRGVCLHQDFACVGNAVTKDLYRIRLEKLKEMGCNAIRCAHHVHSRDFLDLCDEMGFYVYSEFTDKWHSGSYNRYFSNWQMDLDAMLTRDRNRPSVVIWGCGNEVENQAHPSMLDTLKMFSDHIHSFEPSRPVTYAMNPHFKGISGIDASKVADIQKFVDEADEYEIEDLDERMGCISKIAQYVDVLSCNYQEQWFDAIHKCNPTKPIISTEVYQFFIGHKDSMQNFSTNYLPMAFDENYPCCCGGFIWTGVGYLGESMGWSSKGSDGCVLRTTNQPKITAYILKAIWKKEPLVHISAMDYTMPMEQAKEHWGIPPYEDVWDFPNITRGVVPVIIATNCDYVSVSYLDTKGTILRTMYYNPTPQDRINGYMTGFVPYVNGSVVAKGYIEGKEVCSHTLKTPKAPGRLAFADIPASAKPAEGKKLFLTVRLTDEEGTPIVRSTDEVQFSAKGCIKIIAVDNGDMTSHLPYNRTSVKLNRAEACVLVEFTGKGEAEVGASLGNLRGTIQFMLK